MVNMLAPSHFNRQPERRFRQQFVVKLGHFAPARIPAIKMSQFDRQKAALQTFQPKVVTRQAVLILLHRTVVAQHPHPLRQFGIAGDNRSAFAQAAKILSRIEAEATGNAQRTGFAAFVSRAVRLAGVFNQVKIVATRDFEQRIHIRRLAVKMYRQERLGVRRNRRFDQLRDPW